MIIYIIYLLFFNNIKNLFIINTSSIIIKNIVSKKLNFNLINLYKRKKFLKLLKLINNNNYINIIIKNNKFILYGYDKNIYYILIYKNILYFIIKDFFLIENKIICKKIKNNNLLFLIFKKYNKKFYKYYLLEN